MWMLKLCAILCGLMGCCGAAAIERGGEFAKQDQICTVDYQDDSNGWYRRWWSQAMGRKDTAYTGFKFLRVFNFHVASLDLNHYLKIVYCYEGKVQWESLHSIQEDIDWDEPMCVYTGPNIAIANDKWHRRIIGKKKPKISLQSKALNDLSNFHCFKIARRQKYLARKYSIYLPGSWVGGLFLCNVSSFVKQDILTSSRSSNICQANNSIPLLPLLSDDYSGNWITVDKKLGMPSSLGGQGTMEVTKYVPYFNTPSLPSLLEATNHQGTYDIDWKRPKWEKWWSFYNTGGRNSTKLSATSWFNEVRSDEKYPALAGKDSWNMMDSAIDKLAKVSNTPQNIINHFLKLPNSQSGKVATLWNSVITAFQLNNKTSYLHN